MSATYHVAGMTCGGCARSVELAIRQAVPSLEAVSVDLETGTVTVIGAADPIVIADAVDDAGFAFGGPAA